MHAARSSTEAGIESAVLDLGGVPLSELRTLDGSELREALRHVTERVSYIPVTASGSQGARRVD
jgi:FXSXX-COOH protein